MSNEKVLIFKTDTNKLEYHDMPTGGADGVGAGHITILPYSYNSIGQGTWL